MREMELLNNNGKDDETGSNTNSNEEDAAISTVNGGQNSPDAENSTQACDFNCFVSVGLLGEIKSMEKCQGAEIIVN